MWHQTESRPFQSSKTSTAKKKKKSNKTQDSLRWSNPNLSVCRTVRSWALQLLQTGAATNWLALLSGLCEHEQNVDDIFLTILLVLWHLFSGGPLLDRLCSHSTGTTDKCSTDFMHTGSLLGLFVRTNRPFLLSYIHYHYNFGKYSQNYSVVDQYRMVISATGSLGQGVLHTRQIPSWCD